VLAFAYEMKQYTDNRSICSFLDLMFKARMWKGWKDYLIYYFSFRPEMCGDHANSATTRVPVVSVSALDISMFSINISTSILRT
jgi:hypothetical protein